MKRKLLSAVLSAAMILSLAGCGNKAAESTESSAGTEGTQQAPAEEKDGAGDAEKPAEVEDTGAEDASQEEPLTCTLTVWSPSEDQDPEYGQWLNTMCDQFAQLHPNWDITFNYGVCTESETKKLIPQDIDAAADVFIFSSTGMENLCQANCLAELGGKYLDTVRAEYPSVLVDCLTYEDGGVYGVPMTTNTYFMYYDKSVFSQEDITSLDAMLEKGKVAVPLTDGFYMASFYLAAGCDFFGPEGKDRGAGITLDSPESLAMTNYLVDLVGNDNLVVASPADAIAMMREGAVNAYFCGTWQAAQTQEVLGENFGVAPLPSVTIEGSEVQLRPFSSAKAIGVKSTTANPQVAIELAMYLGGYDSQKAHYEMRGYVPCYNKLVAEEEIQKDEVVAVDAYTIDNIAVPRTSFTEMAYFWTPAESFGTELRDGVITHENAQEKLTAFQASANTSGVE